MGLEKWRLGFETVTAMGEGGGVVNRGFVKFSPQPIPMSSPESFRKWSWQEGYSGMESKLIFHCSFRCLMHFLGGYWWQAHIIAWPKTHRLEWYLVDQASLSPVLCPFSKCWKGTGYAFSLQQLNVAPRNATMNVHKEVLLKSSEVSEIQHHAMLAFSHWSDLGRDDVWFTVVKVLLLIWLRSLLNHLTNKQNSMLHL